MRLFDDIWCIRTRKDPMDLLIDNLKQEISPPQKKKKKQKQKKHNQTNK